MIHFEKYQGTGNDFVMLDNRKGEFDEINSETISKLCKRKFGIGADGLIWIKNHDSYDFEMRYFNADGSTSFCGNGARCAVIFAKSLGLCGNSVSFFAIDGAHDAFIKNNLVHIKMNDVNAVNKDGDAFIIHTGSPHYVEFVDNLEKADIVSVGKKIRYSEKYKKEGINVNLLSKCTTGISLLTYERGVENETLSCGTGATAAAIALVLDRKSVV
jgi:diaminopimelate epimerase